MKKILFVFVFLFTINFCFCQAFLQKSRASKHWVDSIFNTLSLEEKIAQLFIVRAHSNLPQDHIDKVSNLIKKYNVGGLCFFQGGPVRQANLTNYFQSITKTPLLVTMDAEWGIGMRLDSVFLFPKNMMLGAVEDPKIVFEIGKAIGKQCKRIGVHINYAPVVDVNNNPANPVINDRSFGENKYKVSDYALAYTNGLQNEKVMACAKHFPGHGDVSVDSHLDLPIINKPFESIDSIELYPFKQQIKNNIGCIMSAHLNVPSIDLSKNKPSSLSKKTITNLLKNKLGYNGLIITDGLEMKGVTKHYNGGEISAQALIAGNDLLCLPEQVDSSILAIKKAIKNKQITVIDIDKKAKKILYAKYNLGLNKKQTIDLNNLTQDLNSSTNYLIEKVAEEAITIVKQSNENIFINESEKQKNIIHLAIGNGKPNKLNELLMNNTNTKSHFFYNSFAATFKIRDSIEPRAMEAFKETKEKFDLAKNIVDSCNKISAKIFISIHQYNRRPANNFGLDSSTIYLLTELGKQDNVCLLFFGNPYAIKNVISAKNIIACYEDNDITQEKAYAIITKKIKAKGKLPVSIN